MFYNILTKLAIIIMLITSNLMLTACGSDDLMSDNESSCDQGLTTHVLYEWSEIRTETRSRMNILRLKEEQCETPECREQIERDIAVTLEYDSLRVNKPVIRECGAIVYFEPEEEGGWPRINFETDTDGDGLTDGREYLLGTNPCAKNSISCELEDGELDYDDDGIPNKDDFQPACQEGDRKYPEGTWEDRSHRYSSDCV